MLYRSHGITRDSRKMTKDTSGPWYYQQINLGYNCCITDVQAAFGCSRRIGWTRLSRVAVNLQSDTTIAGGVAVSDAVSKPKCKFSWQIYVVRLDKTRIKKSKA